MSERSTQRGGDVAFPHAGIYRVDRALALILVLEELHLPFNVVAEEEALHPDGINRIPKDKAYVAFDAGDKGVEEIMARVVELCPTSTRRLR